MADLLKLADQKSNALQLVAIIGIVWASLSCYWRLCLTRTPNFSSPLPETASSNVFIHQCTGVSVGLVAVVAVIILAIFVSRKLRMRPQGNN
jgi:hypothetical protein